MTSSSEAPWDGKPHVAPSILSADFGRLGEQIAAAERGGAGLIHVDVMDGHFVPNLSIGVPIVESLAPTSRLPLDVHLMITDPLKYAGAFIAAGAGLVSFHVEAVERCDPVIDRIQSAGARAGIAVRPGTPLGAIEGLLDRIDFVLLMSVEPGFGGQKFMPAVLDKVAALRRTLEARGRDIPIEVDGGVDLDNVAALVAAGARFLVAGSAVFRRGDPEAATRRLRDRYAAGGGS
jgi:ribulose-phosphate 3-epimerase